MSPLGRLFLGRLAHHLPDEVFGQQTTTPWAGSVLLNARHPLRRKTTPPTTDGAARDPQNLGNLAVLLTFKGQQDDWGPFNQPLGVTPTARELLKLFPLGFCQFDPGSQTHSVLSWEYIAPLSITEVPRFQVHYTRLPL